MEQSKKKDEFTNEEIRNEITEMLCIIDDTWVLLQILKFINNITK